MNKIIAIDFDNTLFKTTWHAASSVLYPFQRNLRYILEPIWGVIERAKEEQRNGAKLILWTCRCGKYLDEAVEACRLVGLIFDAVNKNLPESIEEFDGTDSRKVFAHEYWDDLAVNSSDL